MLNSNEKAGAVILFLVVALGAYSWQALAPSDSDELTTIQITEEAGGPRQARRAQSGNSAVRGVEEAAEMIQSRPISQNEDDQNVIEFQGPGSSGVLVSMLPADAYQLGPQRMVDERMKDPVGFFLKYGEKYRADAKGVLRLPRVKQNFHLAAIADAGFADALIGPYSTKRVVIVLKPVTRMLVRALDSEKSPLTGIDVMYGHRESPSWKAAKVHRELFYATTGKKGLAAINVTSNLEFQRDRWSDAFLAVRGILRPRVFVAIDPDRIPSRPVDLVVGDVGALVLDFNNPDGSQCLQDLRVWIRVVEGHVEKSEAGSLTAAPTPKRRNQPSSFRLTDWPDSGWGGSHVNDVEYRDYDWQGWARDGHLRIPHVTPGLQLEVTVDGGPDSALQQFAERVDGPQNPGGEARATLTFRAKDREATGRLIDTEGRPLARRRGQATFEWGISSLPVEFWTDEKGGVCIPAPVEFQGAANPEFVRICLAGGGFKIPLVASVQILEEGLTKADIELGVVTMRPAEVVAAGRILTFGGTPLSEVSIYAELDHLSDADREVQTLQVVSWPEWPQSDEDGRFCLYGRTSSSTIQLTTYCGRYAPELVVKGTGSRDIEIRMGKSSKLTAQLVLPQEMRSLPLEVEVVSSHLPRPEVKLSRSSYLEVAHMPPGEFRLRLKAKYNIPYVLYESPGYEMEEGKDLNLGEIIVDDSAHWVAFELLNSEFTGPIQVVVKDPQSGEELTTFTMGERVRRIPLPAAAIDVHISGHEKRDLVLLNQKSSHISFRLKEAIRVRLEFDNEVKIPTRPKVKNDPDSLGSSDVIGLRPRMLKIELILGDRRVSRTVKATGIHEFALPSPGRYRVKGTIDEDFFFFKPPTIDLIDVIIEVGDEAETQVKRMRLKEELLQEAIDDASRLDIGDTEKNK